MTVHCSYCNDGPFKRELINDGDEDGIGGLVNGYWFCGWCYKYGMKKDARNEEERMELLAREAEAKDAVRLIEPDEQ